MSLTARVLVLAPALLLLSAVTPSAAADGGWSVAPSGGGRPSFYAEGAPGAVVEDVVSVTNRGGEPVTVRLSATGARVVFARSEVRVPARTRADVPFTVTVPDADRSAEVTARGPDGSFRSVALHLRARVPQLSALTVERVRIGDDGITYEIVNRGTTRLVPRLAVRADGVLGPVLDRPARTLAVELPPGRRIRLTEPWPDRPALDALDVRLTVTAGGGAHDTAHASARFVPWQPVAGGAGAMATAAFLFVRRRRRRIPAELAGADAELTGAVK
ncbi:hypothetical protein BN159_5223 [Streptomyces davaonensis JCM 4913]|uniref:Secreted protein n=1 Tax=Streptomyces davaonensis (strain DSM 101723 / JCM 4913 / KCC S-0913 / 768) TaxID=1214101 RepID=K4R8Y8_STRDJ|nr:hypothetical protein [Streptomyces davaonensis]CCK29602.1 hypothetical protein BN159_5223 [Streptomyces davaonensis JCM 4913]